MHTMLSIALSSELKALLIVFGLIAAAFAYISLNNAMGRQMSGWKMIVERFPMADIQQTDDSFEGRTAIVGSMSYTRSFVIRIANGGVCLYPNFARRNPCLIPWSAIRRVTASDSVHVVVDYERRFEFFLPLKALPAIQAKHSAPSVHKVDSPFEAVKAAIEDKATPRWMAWIAGRTLQSVEREVEKRKEHHDDVA
jgi:hypothetical protein